MNNRIGEEWGSYRLIRLIGQGGFAEVYMGQHTRLTSLRVAIKILSTHLAEESTEVFHREAETIVSLTHPHIIRVLDFALKDGVPYLVMDYAPNGSLRAQHPRGTKVPLSRAVSYIQQVAEGLQYAHDRKIIHRDIKPDNILIGSRGELLLSDFGIATISHGTSSQSAQLAIGTIPYMAPEQIQEHPRQASDQYALAVSLYEWLTGKPPFVGTFTEVAAKHMLIPPAPIRELAPEIPREVEQVVMMALAKEPKTRFSNVMSFASALTEASRYASDDAEMATQPSPHPYRQMVTPWFGDPVPQSQPQSPATPVQQYPLTPPPPGIVMPAQGWNTQPPPVTSPTSINSSDPPAPPAPVSAPVVVTGEVEKPPRKTSRRGALVILALLGGGVVATGSIVLLWNASHAKSSTGSSTGTQGSSAGANAVARGTLLLTYYGHSQPIRTVTWSPDGKSIASGGEDKTVQVWDVNAGKQVLKYQGHTNVVLTAAWSPDGRSIVSGGEDVTTQAWNATTGQLISINRNYSDHVHTAAWSPDGKFIASGSDDHTVQVWNVNIANVTPQTLRFLNKDHDGPVESVAWSPQGGGLLATAGDDGTVKILDSNSGVLDYNYESSPDAAAAIRWVLSVLWSPDGKSIVSAGRDGLVQMWDASTGNALFKYNGQAGWVERIAYSHDGKYIAAAYDNNQVQILDANKGTLLYTYKGHSDQVYSVTWSPDNKYVASAGADKTVQVWAAV